MEIASDISNEGGGRTAMAQILRLKYKNLGSRSWNTFAGGFSEAEKLCF